MTVPAHSAPAADEADGAALEDALEAMPIVARACVARIGPRGTDVLVTLDADRTRAWAQARGIREADDLDAVAGHPAVAALLRRAVADRGRDPAAIRLRVLPGGWLPGPDAFPAPIRRRCVRARFAHLLVTALTPVTTSVLVASGASAVSA